MEDMVDGKKMAGPSYNSNMGDKLKTTRMLKY